MKCSEFEKRIYLYSELTASERKITDDHISQCQSCNVLAAQVLKQSQWIRKTSAIQVEAKHPQRITQRIMNSIEGNEERVRPLGVIISFLDNLFVRYAFSSISIFLVVFFFLEQSEGNQAKTLSNIEIKKGTILNTSAFLKSHLKTREDKKEHISISKYSYYKSERFIKTL